MKRLWIALVLLALVLPVTEGVVQPEYGGGKSDTSDGRIHSENRRNR